MPFNDMFLLHWGLLEKSKITRSQLTGRKWRKAKKQTEKLEETHFLFDEKLFFSLLLYSFTLQEYG